MVVVLFSAMVTVFRMASQLVYNFTLRGGNRPDVKIWTNRLVSQFATLGGRSQLPVHSLNGARGAMSRGEHYVDMLPASKKSFPMLRPCELKVC